MLQDFINNINPNVIWEIGVGNPHISRVLPYLNTEIELHLFEPNYKTFVQLRNTLGRSRNVILNNFGLYDKDSEVDFYDEDDSTSMVGIDSPTKVIGGGRFGLDWLKDKPRTKMIIKDIARIDTGNIDVALIDTEGCEFVIVNRMVSRPKLLVLETHNENYITPNFDELNRVLKERGYSQILHHNNDSYYLRQ